MDDLKFLSHYCVGCGLCKTKHKAEIIINSKGYYEVLKGDIEWLKKVCPCYGVQTNGFSGSIWGKYEKVYLGWSKDSKVRKLASSGGALTELASYVLESGFVDGIIHTCFSAADPTQTDSCISQSREELIERCGSRYSISHPLEILNRIDLSKKYAFIGKPCDVDSLTNAFSIYPELKQSIILTMSFFCAGLPSFEAQERLLNELGCMKEKCVSLRYRGDGWPGFATARDNDGKEYRMDYDSSWGKILGRDIMPMCRVCINGVGESADIACADGWYISEDGKPDFSEKEGRNVIFARTKLGLDIINDSVKSGCLFVEEFTHAEKLLPQMQYFQAGRRQSMLTKKLAFKLFSRPFPYYNNQIMRKYNKDATFIYRFKMFKGTIDRIRKGAI